jgi:hypothetical protein
LTSPCRLRFASRINSNLTGGTTQFHHDALAVLSDRYRLVLNVARHTLRDAREAEDLMRLVFPAVLRCAAQFDAAKGTAKVVRLPPQF